MKEMRAQRATEREVAQAIELLKAQQSLAVSQIGTFHVQGPFHLFGGIRVMNEQLKEFYGGLGEFPGFP